MILSESSLKSFSLQWINQRTNSEWKVSLGMSAVSSKAIENCQDIWHPSEQPLWNELTYERRMNQFLAGRLAGKSAVAQYLRLGGDKNPKDLQSIAILRGSFDQPILQLDHRAVPELSLSHTESQGIAIATEPGYKTGIDIESFTPEREKGIRSVIESTLGRSSYECYPDHCRDFIEWTSYESLSKALTIGLTYPFKKIQVLKTTNLIEGVWRRTWKDFMQYQTLSFELKTGIVSLTLPTDTVPTDGDQGYSYILKQLREIDTLSYVSH